MNRRRYPRKNYQRKRRKTQPKTQRDSPRFQPKASRQLKPLLAEIGVPRATPFVPDPFQLRAVDELQYGDVLVTAATGSGKTWIALQAMEKLLAQGQRSWYASPLKALSNSKYTEFCHKFGQEKVGILTGDRKENPQAPIVVGTTEILRNQLYDSMHRGEDYARSNVLPDR